MKLKFAFLIFILYLTTVGIMTIKYKSDLTVRSYRIARLFYTRKQLWWKRQKLHWEVSRLKEPGKIIRRSKKIGIQLSPENNFIVRDHEIKENDNTASVTD